MALEALIFDCDGLLLDTETPDFHAWSAIYQEYGCDLAPEDWFRGVGTWGGFKPLDELERRIGRPLDRAALMARQRATYLERCQHLPLLPGVRALIEAAHTRGLKLAVASSSDRPWVEGWLDRHRLRAYFQCVRTRDDVARVKPAPDLFLAAAACLDVAPERCVVLEDSLNGVRAAAAAGMRCVAVPIALVAGLELAPVALRLPSLAALPPGELLRRLEAPGAWEPSR